MGLSAICWPGTAACTNTWLGDGSSRLLVQQLWHAGQWQTRSFTESHTRISRPLPFL